MSGGAAGSAVTSGSVLGPLMAGACKGVGNGAGIRPCRAAFGSGRGAGKFKSGFCKGAGDGAGLGGGLGLGMGEGTFKRGLEDCAFATLIGATATIRTTRMLESGRMTGPSIAVPRHRCSDAVRTNHRQGLRFGCIDRNCAISLNLGNPTDRWCASDLQPDRHECVTRSTCSPRRSGAGFALCCPRQDRPGD